MIRKSRVLNFLLALLLTLGISLAAQPSQAQFSLPEGFGQSQIVGPPANVTRYGNLETMPVESPLSFRDLFTIAAATVYDRSPVALAEKQTVEQRAEEIGARLLLLLSRPMDAETLVFDLAQLNSIKIIRARDARFTQPLVLMSVTELDAEFNGLPVDQLAEQWRSILEQDLRVGLKKLPQAQRRVLQILLGLVMLTGMILGLKQGLSRQQRQLRQRKQAISSTASPVESKLSEAEVPAALEEQLVQRRSQFLQQLQQLFNLDRRLSALDFAQWLLFWLLILIWYGGGFWAALTSPYLLRNQFKFVEVPLDLLGVWFFTGLLIRISRYLIDRFSKRWETPNLKASFLDSGDAQRHQLRASTIGGAAKGLVTLVLLMLGLLWGLNNLGLPTASTVAFLSLLALAISFGSRRLVEDLVNGFLILAEDQYAIGDVIDLGTVAGLVENLNLRVTQLRSSSGELITIPNSKINEVRNLTRDWSRVAFSIDVAYQTDPDQALAALRTVAETLYQDPQWHDKIVAEPTVLGIDSISHSGMTLTAWIQTEPAEQWAVGREFRLRVRRALAENGIEIGAPRQTYALEPARADDKPGSQEHTDSEI